jgi:gag-pre-integrase-like protein
VGLNYLFKAKHALSATDESPAQSVDILTLHQRLGHISVDTIHALIHAGSITGLQLINDSPPFTYDSCEYAKTT